MEELDPPPTVFDTYIPGLISTQRAAAVGAVRMGSFEVFPGGDDTFTLLLRYYWPRDEAEGPSAARQADALRRYIIPCLLGGKECVVEIADPPGAVGLFVLVTMMRDAGGEIRFVSGFLVECPHRTEAERRLRTLQDMTVS